MNSMKVNNCFYKVEYVAKNQRKTSKCEKTETSFSARIEKNVVKKNYTSATEDFKKRHPENASHVDSQIQAGKKLLKKNGVENICRELMSMDEYKKFFTDLMNAIPYDWSQKNDVNVWSITEAGWEQMKNDPDYEAWVLGYTVEDRSVNIPFASMPGYFPSFHTEHFGASIDEHLGQGMPMNNSVSHKALDNGESWWDKRQRIMREKVASNSTSFTESLQGAENTGSERVDTYRKYLANKYGVNVSVQNIGKDQKSLDRVGKSMCGNDVIIAPNILERMANDSEKAAYYEQKIDYFFYDVIPRETALCASKGLVFEPGGVVIHEDGSVTYICGCSDSPERVAEVNAINKAKREKEVAKRKASLERSQEAAEQQR